MQATASVEFRYFAPSEHPSLMLNRIHQSIAITSINVAFTLENCACHGHLKTFIRLILVLLN